ncbi:MAG TPA: hypothetical protein VM283_07685, partial [Armatimonadota bacterium]|nr:hypothetical protein [Armatimonadota bacterium]
GHRQTGEVSAVDSETYSKYSRQIITLVEGTMVGDVQKSVERLLADEQYDLIADVLITASEVSARRLVDALLAREIIEPLIPAACLRRELRRPSMTGGASLGGGAIFRDFETDDEGPGVPDFIREEAEAITTSANQSRRIAAQKEAELDRDAIRARIVDQLVERLNTSDEALKALATIARTSAFEETRRGAAMKLANNKIATGKLIRAGRHRDLLVIADASGSIAVKSRIARSLAEAMPDQNAPEYRPALELVAEHHPDEETKAAARGALNG